MVSTEAYQINITIFKHSRGLQAGGSSPARVEYIRKSHLFTQLKQTFTGQKAKREQSDQRNKLDS